MDGPTTSHKLSLNKTTTTTVGTIQPPMKTKKNYRVTTLFPEGDQFTLTVETWGISWIPNESEKQLRINCPKDYLQAEIIKIEKL